MDIEKLKAEFEQTECFKRLEHVAQYTFFEFGAYIKRTDVPADIEKKCGKLITALLFSWSAWKEAQAVPEWISVEDKLPETEPNTDGVVCAVVCSLGNVYRARYMHDVDIGVDTKYWSEFAVNYNGREYEHYEINAKISHWMPLPDAPQEPANEL